MKSPSSTTASDALFTLLISIVSALFIYLLLFKWRVTRTARNTQPQVNLRHRSARTMLNSDDDRQGGAGANDDLTTRILEQAKRASIRRGKKPARLDTEWSNQLYEDCYEKKQDPPSRHDRACHGVPLVVPERWLEYRPDGDIGGLGRMYPYLYPVDRFAPLCNPYTLADLSPPSTPSVLSNDPFHGRRAATHNPFREPPVPTASRLKNRRALYDAMHPPETFRPRDNNQPLRQAPRRGSRLNPLATPFVPSNSRLNPQAPLFIPSTQTPQPMDGSEYPNDIYYQSTPSLTHPLDPFDPQDPLDNPYLFDDLDASLTFPELYDLPGTRDTVHGPTQHEPPPPIPRHQTRFHATNPRPRPRGRQQRYPFVDPSHNFAEAGPSRARGAPAPDEPAFYHTLRFDRSDVVRGTDASTPPRGADTSSQRRGTTRALHGRGRARYRSLRGGACDDDDEREFVYDPDFDCEVEVSRPELRGTGGRGRVLGTGELGPELPETLTLRLTGHNGEHGGLGPARRHTICLGEFDESPLDRAQRLTRVSEAELPEMEAPPAPARGKKRDATTRDEGEEPPAKKGKGRMEEEEMLEISMENPDPMGALGAVKVFLEDLDRMETLETFLQDPDRMETLELSLEDPDRMDDDDEGDE